jgi:putative intracellular protease/amidase
MNVAIVIFDGLAALDAVGPNEVLSNTPGVDVTFVAQEARPHRTDNGALALVADQTLDEVPNPDVLLIPGGVGTRRLLHNEALLEWVRAADATTTWTTSVCTGALVLGAAGLLEGKRATTAFSELETLKQFGATPVEERYVHDGKILTSAGVSAGIDMALYLAALLVGEELAKAVQLGIEYDPQPPFDCGSPAKAGPELTERVRVAIARQVAAAA